MSNVLRKITYAKKSGETWDSEIELTTARPQEIIIGWGSQKDSASVKISKANKFFDSLNTSITPDIAEEDLVRFYIAKNKTIPHTFTNDDLLFEGTVDTATQTLGESGNEVTIKTFNFYEVFFDVELPYYEENYNFIEHAQELLNLLRNAGTIIEWDTNNPTLKKDGLTSLPKTTLALDYTPAFVILEKLCSNEYTDDGQYYWYLSKGTTGKRQLSIRPKDDTISGTIDETLPIQSISIEKGKDAVKNYVIYNVGTDLYGNTVEDFIFDASSIGKYGWKTDFIIDETGHHFSSLHVEEYIKNSGDFTFDSNGALSSPFPSGYPYTFYFDSTITVSDDSDFNEQLRIKALAQGNKYAQTILDDNKKTQYIVNINFPYTNQFIVGGLYDFNISRLREFGEQLRIKQITYSMNGITVSFDQDTKDRA